MSFTYPYPRPAVTVDCIVIRKFVDDYKILLIERGNEPYKNCWALPGGFLDMDEELDEAALRELREETGVSDIALEQFKTYGNIGRDPRARTISVIFFGVASENIVLLAGDDAKNAAWFSIKILPDLAFDHNVIVSEFLDFFLSKRK